LEFNLSTGLDLGRDGTILSTLVADDVAARVAAAVDETQIGSGFRPTDAVRRAAHVRVLVDEVSSVVCAINNGTRHVSVTSDQSGRAEKNSCNLRDRHVVGFIVLSKRSTHSVILGSNRTRDERKNDENRTSVNEVDRTE
jgi:hypothetical protein